MKNNTTIFHPAWVTGFIDGEGTFFVDLLKNKTMALNIQVQLQFSITQHIRDADLMRSLVDFFGAGIVVSDGPTKVQYRIRWFADFEQSLFPLLDEYPLMTQKRLDAEAFRKVHALMKDGRHLTPDGLDEIRAIKNTMNRARMLEFKK
jgi:LAGLIDADG endonuclease